MFVSNRAMVRMISFVTAGMLFLLGIVVANTVRTNNYRRQLERQYIRSIQEIAVTLNAISTDMQKAAYAGTPAQVASLSAQVWRGAGSAKAAFGNLPISELNLDVTYRFLSQVGDYSMYLSGKAARGEEISAEERESYEKLTVYAGQLSRQINHMERVLSSGSIDVADFLEAQLTAAEEELAPVAQVAVGFLDVEEGFDGYPALIYDGPFSDHLMERSPVMTQNLPQISRTQARETAARFAGLEPEQLQDAEDELSRMPSYRFQSYQVAAGVTKQGGYVTYILNQRPVREAALDIPQARKRAAEYLEAMGMSNMGESYYELAGGILTVNYAYVQQEVTCYTDLIKVGVAMDNGDVLFYDARGFINNHRERRFEEPALSPSEAERALSPNLSVRGVRLALIPTGGLHEVLTYEFTCTGVQGEDVLVYINARTGAEEQILILIKNENGALVV